MKLPLFAAMLVVFEVLASAASLPVITVNPTNRLIAPGSTVTLTVAATDAQSFQWRRNGVDLTDATNTSLTITNAQSTNSGYYLAIAKNATGWTPSQMAYLNVTGGGGVVPFSNAGNSGQFALVRYNNMVNLSDPPVTNGIATLVAGPEIDQMQPVPGAVWDFADYSPFDHSYDGIFDDVDYSVPTVNPGQTISYQVSVVVPQQPTWNRPSTMLKLVAGGGANPTPSISNLQFPYYIEWPETRGDFVQPTNQLRVTGETTTLQIGITSYAIPKVQWRKDGKELSGATNVADFNPPFTFSGSSSLVLSNLQPADSGVYDMVIYGRNWVVSPRISISIQSQNGAGIFQSPRQSDNQFLSDFVGAAGRNYMVECSTDLASWTNLITLTNTTGTLTFSNSIPPDGNLFYRSRLLP